MRGRNSCFCCSVGCDNERVERSRWCEDCWAVQRAKFIGFSPPPAPAAFRRQANSQFFKRVTTNAVCRLTTPSPTNGACRSNPSDDRPCQQLEKRARKNPYTGGSESSDISNPPSPSPSPSSPKTNSFETTTTTPCPVRLRAHPHGYTPTNPQPLVSCQSPTSACQTPLSPRPNIPNQSCPTPTVITTATSGGDRLDMALPTQTVCNGGGSGRTHTIWSRGPSSKKLSRTSKHRTTTKSFGAAPISALCIPQVESSDLAQPSPDGSRLERN